MNLKKKIREIPDWPEKGVNFKDITPLLQDKEAFVYAVDKMAEPYIKSKPDLIVGIDARGFILSAAMAYKLNTGLVLIRKKGKLPFNTLSEDYSLEYAVNTIEMHEDAISSGQKVLVVDDVLATGGTMEATLKMIKRCGGDIVGVSFLIELGFLGGRKKLGDYEVNSLLNYEK